jgi:hypothetical protein
VPLGKAQVGSRRSRRRKPSTSSGPRSPCRRTTPPAEKARTMGSLGPEWDRPTSARFGHRAERARVTKGPARGGPVEGRVAQGASLPARHGPGGEQAPSRAAYRRVRVACLGVAGGTRRLRQVTGATACEQAGGTSTAGRGDEPRPSVCHPAGADASLHIEMVPPIALPAWLAMALPGSRRWHRGRAPARARAGPWRDTSRARPAPAAPWLRGGSGSCPRRRARRVP